MSAPDGREWKVRRRWRPDEVGRARWRGPREFFDMPFGFDGAGGILAAIVVAIVVAVLLAYLIPLLIFILEVLLILAVIGIAVFGRVVLRKPWRLVLRPVDEGGGTRAWHVVGWRSSRRAIAAIKDAVQAGREPDPPGAEEVSLRPGDNG